MSISDFLDEQSSEGNLHSSGVFCIDLERAGDKLKRYSLPNRCDYLSKLIQYANLNGIERVDCQVEPALVRLKFIVPSSAGNLFACSELAEQLLDHNMSADHSRALLLAGLNGVLALSPRSLVVRDQNGEELSLLHKADVAEQSEPSAEESSFLVEIRRRPDKGASADECERLKTRCCFGSSELNLNGELCRPLLPNYPDGEGRELLPSGYVLGGHWKRSPSGFRLAPPPEDKELKRTADRQALAHAWKGEGECLSDVVTIRYGGRTSGRLHLVQHGVLIETKELKEWTGLGVDALVDASQLATDLSGLRVVEKGDYHRLVKRLEGELKFLRAEVRANLSRLRATTSVPSGYTPSDMYGRLSCWISIPTAAYLVLSFGKYLTGWIPRPWKAKWGLDIWLSLLTFAVLGMFIFIGFFGLADMVTTRRHAKKLWAQSDRQLRAQVSEMLGSR